MVLKMKIFNFTVMGPWNNVFRLPTTHGIIIYFFEIINFLIFNVKKIFRIETTNNHQDFKESLFTTTSKSNEYKKN